MRILISVGLIIAAALFLYSDFVVKNKTFNPTDIQAFRNSAQVSLAYKEANPDVDEVLWNPNMFGGMPNFMINYSGKVDFIDSMILRITRGLPHQFVYTILFAIFIFTLIYSLTRQWEVATVLAIISVFLPNYVSLYEAGHNTKAHTTIFFGGMLYTFIRTLDTRNWIWALAFSLFTLFSLRSGHPQIFYYSVLSLFGFGVYYLASDKYGHTWTQKAQVTGLFAAGILLAVAVHATVVLPVREYAELTIRGGGGGNQSAGTTGLSHAYANSWSFHPGELLTLLNPSYFGLDHSRGTGALYWGWMPFTSTSYYMGVILVPLAVIGLIREWAKPKIRGLVIVMMIAMVIAFGKHNFIPYLNEFMLDYIPFYNKFRSPNVSMSFVQVILFIFAGFGIKQLIEHKSELTRLTLIVFGSVMGIMLISILAQSSMSFAHDVDVRRYGQNVNQVIALRQDLFADSMLKSLGILAVGAVMIFLYITERVKLIPTLIVIGLISSFDLLSFSTPYFKRTVTQSAFTGQFGVKRQTDEFLLKDTEQFRVLPMGQMFGGDTHWSYYHENMGGYSAAKLSNLQTILEKGRLEQLPNFSIASTLNIKYLLYRVQNQQQLNQINRQLQSVGLKFKHLDQQTGVLTYLNPGYVKRLWVPDSVVQQDVNTQLESIQKPGWNPKSLGFVDATVTTTQPDSFAFQKKMYDVHTQEYTVTLDRDGYVFVSEIYYPNGWKAWIDDQPVEIKQANFINRAVRVPAGTHTLRFVFEPDTYTMARTVTQISVWIYILLILFAVYLKKDELLTRLNSISESFKKG